MTDIIREIRRRYDSQSRDVVYINRYGQRCDCADYDARAQVSLPVLSFDDIDRLFASIDSLEEKVEKMRKDIFPSCQKCASHGTYQCPGGKCCFQGYDYFIYKEG